MENNKIRKIIRSIIKEEFKNQQKYRIVSDYGYGDKSWIERDLDKQDVVDWFVKMRNYDKDTTFEELPNQYSETTYYYEKDNIDDVEDWNWEDS